MQDMSWTSRKKLGLCAQLETHDCFSILLVDYKFRQRYSNRRSSLIISTKTKNVFVLQSLLLLLDMFRIFGCSTMTSSVFQSRFSSTTTVYISFDVYKYCLLFTSMSIIFSIFAFSKLRYNSCTIQNIKPKFLTAVHIQKRNDDSIHFFYFYRTKFTHQTHRRAEFSALNRIFEWFLTVRI